MSSAAGERREVVIFSPTQLAEGFSAFPLNGGETFGMWERWAGAALCKLNKRGLWIGPRSEPDQGCGGSWDWGLDKGPTSSTTLSVSSSQGQWPQIAFWEAEACKTGTRALHLWSKEGIELWIELGKDKKGQRAAVLCLSSSLRGPRAGAHITFWVFTDTSALGRDSSRRQKTKDFSNTQVHYCHHSGPYLSPAKQRKASSPLGGGWG